ncbi:hypothetical protein GCM10007387_59800 [Pseudoduganella albidiflava]|uniref:Uncharacterized protein n=1 Tax=Pseudoduganella albidiflava TaxID=321983 RepID=A0AA88C606_9BURK|nr:hypothetical protein GCM10007387_59800 [Pseudoduganella albidiflava]
MLWEIARLRSIATRAHQYLIGPDGLIEDVLRRELDECACVKEQQRVREEGGQEGVKSVVRGQ